MRGKASRSSSNNTTKEDQISNAERRRRQKIIGKYFRSGKVDHMMPNCKLSLTVKCNLCNNLGYISPACDKRNSASLANAIINDLSDSTPYSMDYPSSDCAPPNKILRIPLQRWECQVKPGREKHRLITTVTVSPPQRCPSDQARHTPPWTVCPDVFLGNRNGVDFSPCLWEHTSTMVPVCRDPISTQDTTSTTSIKDALGQLRKLYHAAKKRKKKKEGEASYY